VDEKRDRATAVGAGVVREGATVPVALVTSRTEAELIVGMLRAHRVTATVSADDAGAQYPSMQTQGVRVLVAPVDEASARELLADAENVDAGPIDPKPPRETPVT
jgi:hypothetical protein